MSFFAIFKDSGCCGEIAIKVAPKTVSGLVVKISIFSSELFIWKLIVAPLLLPIQFLCMVFTLSGHSFKLSISLSKSSAKSEIFRNHPFIFFFSTSAPDRHPRPSTTCSLAKTVCSTGSQLTNVSFL